MKKKTGLLMVALLMAFSSFGQKLKEKALPARVSETFRKQYPEAKEVTWEMENDHYEVEFDLNEEDHSVLYDSTGKVLGREVEIKASELPVITIDYLQKNYPGKKIMEAAKITSADGTVTYEAKIKKRDLIFDSNGTYIRTTKD